MKNVLLIGASSEIGLAIVERLRADGPITPYLLGRAQSDAEDTASIEPAVASAFEQLGTVDVAVLAVGMLGAQAGLDADPAEAARVLDVNVVGCGALLLATLRRLRAQGHGSLIVLSSVGAERPRASNAVYGAAKAGLDALAQGLSDSLKNSPVEVIIVRPGFVRTKMTAGLKPAPLATSAEAVAEASVGALGHGSRTVWVPRSLRPLFAVLRHLPRPVYRRLPL
jgi:decaprenylphospho-beta-D-erythro-pentofuranosid-2-ulose 2-reductase